MPAAGQQTLAVGLAACGQSQVGNPLPKDLRGPLLAQKQPTGTNGHPGWKELASLPACSWPGSPSPREAAPCPLQCLEHLYHLHPEVATGGNELARPPARQQHRNMSKSCSELRAH